MLLRDVPYYEQKLHYTCGPASLKMVLEYLGTEAHRDILRRIAESDEHVGTNYRGMIRAVRYHGHRCFVRKNASPRDMHYFLRMNLPVVINWYIDAEKTGHFSVVVGLSKGYITINDPAHGPRVRMKLERFLEVWHDTTGRNRNWMMVVLPKRIRIKVPAGKIYKPRPIPSHKDRSADSMKGKRFIV
ncbi:MAG: peptidase C39 family protein [Candidatus Thermoplasmatota archaeon]